MQLTRLQRAAAAALALTLSSALAACQPTGNPRCDALTAQRAITESIGYRVRCDADSPGVSVGGRSVLGWPDHRSRTIWLWPSKMAGNPCDWLVLLTPHQCDAG